MAERLMGYTPSGLFGYTHMLGGYAGGQAQYARVPHADVGCLKVPDSVSDEQVLFLSDIFPTGYMAAENCDIKPGDVVAIWGCGPVGQFAIRSAYLLGAERVIAIDRFPERLRMAAEGGAEVINYSEQPGEDVVEAVKEMTGGRGPDACIDAVGMEAHGTGVIGAYDKVKQETRVESDRPTVLRQVIMACRNGGTLSIAGVYSGFIDKVPFGSIMNRSLTLHSGQTHVQRYMRPLLQRIENGEIDPSFIITHRMSLSDAPRAYEMFRDKRDDCVKVVLTP
jgi:threonine dehydrogenase-like Zn-dependent dehydrogenase